MRARARTLSLEQILAAAAEPEADAGTRAVLVFSAGGRLFALDAATVERIASRRFVAPVPAGPAHLHGVASVTGRMRLVVDPAGRPAGGDHPRVLVALHGDAQLALVADRVHAVLTVPDGEPIRYEGADAEPLDVESLLDL